MNTSAAFSPPDKAQSSARIEATCLANLISRDNKVKAALHSHFNGSTAATVNTFPSSTLKRMDCNVVRFAPDGVQPYTSVTVVTRLVSNQTLHWRQRTS